VTRQEQVAFYAAEDAIKRITELEAANAKLSKDLASHQLQNTEAQMLQVLPFFLFLQEQLKGIIITPRLKCSRYFKTPRLKLIVGIGPPEGRFLRSKCSRYFKTLQNTEAQMLQVRGSNAPGPPFSGHPDEYPKYFMSKAPQIMSRGDARKDDTD
jgi:hypothetical protein